MWQREWLQGEALEEHLKYWREQLEGAPTLLEMPTDRPRGMVRSQQGAVIRFSLGPELSAGLKELSQRQGVTLFMLLLGVFQLLLSRYSGQEEVMVGTPIAGRTRKEVEGLIGFFVNMLVMRGRIRCGESFVEYLKRVKEMALGAYAHQEMPFEKLVEELRPEQSLSHNPLFQVTFSLQNLPRGEFKARYSDGIEAARFAEENDWMPIIDSEVYSWQDIPRLANDYAENRLITYFPIFQINSI